MAENSEQRPASRRRAPSPWWRERRLRAPAVIVLAVVIGVVVWLLVRGGNSANTSAAAGTAATAVSEQNLLGFATTTKIPIFWAGARAGDTYEYTRTSSNRVYVRYLPAGVAVGSSQPFLTVGTYPLTNAYAISQTVSKRAGGTTIPLSGGIAFYNVSDPAHVYMAYPGVNYQVEVYDPAPGAAKQLVASGSIVPISGKLPTPTGPVTPSSFPARAMTPSALRALATTVDHPVYWVGAEKGMKLEVTETAGARIYLRYLPAGVKIGSGQPYLTIGSYPVTNAYKVVKSLSKKSGSVPVAVKGNAVAFYTKTRPTNVYLALKGSNIQIEVYDPNAKAARSLVTGGHIVSVG